MNNGLKAPSKPKALYIAGHAGLVGSALARRFLAEPGFQVITAPRAEVDLTDRRAVESFLIERRPDIVCIAAGKVGGIQANAQQPASFIYENLMIGANLIHGAWRTGVKRLIHFGSSCMYPRDCPQPMRPDRLGTGPMEPTSEPYALAKWAGFSLCSSYNRQYGTRFLTAIPATVYGPNDHFDLESSHVLSALLRRLHEAEEEGVSAVTLWGSGTARREFLFADDLAEAVHLLLERYEGEGPINVGSGESFSIQELAEQAAQVVGFRGEIRWDPSRPDGAPEKRLDSAPLRELGWFPRTSLREGLRQTYRWFLENVLCASS